MNPTLQAPIVSKSTHKGSVFDSRKQVLGFNILDNEAQFVVAQIAGPAAPLRYRRPGIVIYANFESVDDCRNWKEEAASAGLRTSAITIHHAGLCRPIYIGDKTKHNDIMMDVGSILQFHRKRAAKIESTTRERAAHYKQTASLQAVVHDDTVLGLPAEDGAVVTSMGDEFKVKANGDSFEIVGPDGVFATWNGEAWEKANTTEDPDRAVRLKPETWRQSLAYNVAVRDLYGVIAEDVKKPLQDALAAIKKQARVLASKGKDEPHIQTFDCVRAKPSLVTNNFATIYVMLSNSGTEALIGVTGLHATRKAANDFIQQEIAEYVGGAGPSHLVVATNRFIDLWQLQHASSYAKASVVDNDLETLGVTLKPTPKQQAEATQIDQTLGNNQWAMDEMAARVAAKMEKETARREALALKRKAAHAAPSGDDADAALPSADLEVPAPEIAAAEFAAKLEQAK